VTLGNEHTRALQEGTTHNAPPGTGSDDIEFQDPQRTLSGHTR